MLKTDFGWQGIVSSVQVISWDDREEGGRFLKHLRREELDVGVGRGARVRFCDSPFFRFSMVLRYC